MANSDKVWGEQREEGGGEGVAARCRGTERRGRSGSQPAIYIYTVQPKNSKK